MERATNLTCGYSPSPEGGKLEILQGSLKGNGPKARSHDRFLFKINL